MHSDLITLTTDFGTASPYVAAMKGVILSIAPHVRILDLSHDIPAQDIWHGAFFLAGCVPYFPPEAVHVVVVDPGVGTERRLLYTEIGPHRLILPDNGLATLLLRRFPLRRAFQILEPRYRLPVVSNTFHGRDILGPAAAHVALGIEPAHLGPQVHDPYRLPVPEPQVGETIRGKVIFVDGFGNLITNIEQSLLEQAGMDPKAGRVPVVLIAARRIARWVRTYGEAKPGELVALISSSGYLEIAEVQGSAARTLSAGRGTPVEVSLENRTNGI
ncbi:MAG: SAM-dependent chlorinase/fluorinase [Gemmatales bacterium]|nr:SAM-dependent chlorinase/fluorinase [Gemmatales bacterium]MDW8385730.1 SAM-dependent chlorinase/fluorinase [Gemmatales bacterium]